MIVAKAITVSILLLSAILTGCAPKASSEAFGPPVAKRDAQQAVVDHEGAELASSEALQLVHSACAGGDVDAYRMGPEDSLAVVVFGEKELSGIYTIDNTGAISMPLIGEVVLAGCTLRKAEDVISTHYADGYLVSPSVSIEISDFRPFYILGEVKLPGKYDFAAGMNVLKASALAGGFTYRANRKVAKILRYGANGQAVYHKQRLEDAVQPGDVITIQERLF